VNFEKTYGDIGKQFIHVHHINELALLNTGRFIDPVTDLRPVCPNCHAMLQKKESSDAFKRLKENIRRTPN
jgi:5-methylcytosine-specific restriction protein A